MFFLIFMLLLVLNIFVFVLFVCLFLGEGRGVTDICLYVQIVMFYVICILAF